MSVGMCFGEREFEGGSANDSEGACGAEGPCSRHGPHRALRPGDEVSQALAGSSYTLVATRATNSGGMKFMM